MDKIEVRAGFLGLRSVRQGDKWAYIAYPYGGWVGKDDTCKEEFWNSLDPVTDQDEIDKILSHVDSNGNTWETV